MGRSEADGDTHRPEFIPPAPAPRVQALGPIALLRVLANNPVEAWTAAHFEQPIVMGGLSIAKVAVVSEPRAIKRILLDNPQNYHKDWLQRRILSAGLTCGLLTAEDQQWRVQRRALASLFARKTVTSFVPAMVAASNALAERLSGHEGQVIDLVVEVTRVTLDVLERTIFSDGLGRGREDIRIAMKSYFETIGRLNLVDILGLPDFVPRPGYWKLRPTLRLFEDTIDTIIATRRARLARDPADAPSDILTLLLEARDPESGEALSEFEIRANILTFIAAGHETTSNCIAWTLSLLSQSNEWCERIQAEADRALDGATNDLCNRLIETRAVIDESNRLYPPITAISRVALGEDELAGQPIKRGTMIVIAPYVLHRHCALWERPNSFDPNRFLAPARESVDRFAYLPFGAGPRVCIGASFAIQEASIVLATLMRHFTFVLKPGHVVWPVQKVTLRPKGGLPLLVQRRQSRA